MENTTINYSDHERIRIKVALTMHADSLGALGKLPTGLLDRLANKAVSVWDAREALNEFLNPPKPKKVRKPRKSAPKRARRAFGGRRALHAAGRDFIADMTDEQVLEFQDGGEAHDIAEGVTETTGWELDGYADDVHHGMMTEQEKRVAKINK